MEREGKNYATDWATKPGTDGRPNHYRLPHVDWLTSLVGESKTENLNRQEWFEPSDQLFDDWWAHERGYFRMTYRGLLLPRA